MAKQKQKKVRKTRTAKRTNPAPSAIIGSETSLSDYYANRSAIQVEAAQRAGLIRTLADFYHYANS